MIKYKNLFSYIKMVKEILRFSNIKIEKKKILPLYNSPIFKKGIDITKVLVSNKISLGEKKL